MGQVERDAHFSSVTVWKKCSVVKACENEPAVVTQFQTFKQTVACYKTSQWLFSFSDS